MAAPFKDMDIKWNLPAFRTIRCWPSTRAEVARRAEAVADIAGGDWYGYVVRSERGRNRARAAVITSTGKAIRHNQKTQALTTALAVMRGRS